MNNTFKTWHSLQLPENCSISFETKRVCKFTFSIVHFISSHNRSSIPDENLTFELICSVSIIYTLDFKDLLPEKRMSNMFFIIFNVDLHWNDNILDIAGEIKWNCKIITVKVVSFSLLLKTGLQKQSKVNLQPALNFTWQRHSTGNLIICAEKITGNIASHFTDKF